MNHLLNWRLPGFGLVLVLFLAALLFSMGSGLADGPSVFLGLALSFVGVSTFIVAMRGNHLSSKLRAFSEWALIGFVWILIVAIIATAPSLH